MILYGDFNPLLLVSSFILIGFIGGLIKGIVGVGKSILGAASGIKTSPNASYESFLQKQRQSQREHENRMAQIAAAQAKKTGMTISPIMIFGGVAVVAMIFLPQIMGRR